MPLSPSLEKASTTTLKTFQLQNVGRSGAFYPTKGIGVEKVGENLGWKIVLLVQFQAQFIFAIYVGILVSYGIVVYEAGKALAVMENELPLTEYMTDTRGIIYSMDAFYIVDVIFMIIYKNIEWPEFNYRYKPRNAAILTMEALTLIPVDAIYYSVARNKKESYVALLRLRYVLRMIRLLYEYRTSSPITDQLSMLKDTTKVFVGMGLVSITLATIVPPYVCQLKCFPHNMTHTFNYNLYVASEKITGKGFGHTFYHDTLSSDFTIHLFSLTGFGAYILMGYIISKIICTFISRDKHTYSFLIKYTKIKTELGEWKNRRQSSWRAYDESLYSTVQSYYKMVWTNRRWYVTKAFKEQVLPSIMFKDIYLDISWNAFKHSHLFKNEEVHFLREVSRYVCHTVYAPGEVIYRRHQQKSGMAYIRTGIVQILSGENGETPIVSFSGGTCLGDSSLLVDYTADWSVLCKTYCEVAFLNRKDFIRVSLIYPRVYRKLIKSIRKRYHDAKRYKKLSEYQWYKESITNPDTMTMIWLKKTLHHLNENNSNYRIDDLSWNAKLAFCPDYLDLLVITEDIELVSDRIFLKKKFPFVFQPESIFLDGWNIFIAILSIIALVAYPCYMLHCSNISPIAHMICLTIVTSIWCIDLYIQSSTGVRTKDTLHSNIPSIIYYRLTNTGFLVDVFSALPFSILFTLIDGQITYETLLLTESHKLLKAYRIRFLFYKLEMLRLRTKVVLKYLKVFLIDFFLFYYTGIIFYYIMCRENTDCSRDYLQKIQPLTDEVTKWRVMLHLYVMAALFLGNMTFVDFLKYISYENIPIVVLIQFLYTFFNIFVVSYTAIMETLKESKVHQYKEFVSTMDVLMRDLKVSEDLQKRIRLYLRDQFWVDKGLRVLHPSLFLNNMSDNLYLITSQVCYGKFLKDIPLFAELDEYVIIDAARKVNSTHYPPGEVITYAGEVCKEMYVIEFGFCKILGSQVKVLEPSDSFCVIETCMQIPTFYTVVTLTDCKVLSLSYIEYARLSTKYPGFRASVNEALEQSIREHDVRQIQSSYREVENLALCQEVKVPLARSFKYDTWEEKREFNREFSTYSYLFKFILMRHTFPTYGKFLFYWEISRMIFAIATNVFSSFAYTFENSFVYYFSLCMDITAWVDLYVRHHVCYYTKDGIEVSHPAKTSAHYWKNGLLLDFIACAPIDYMCGRTRGFVYLRSNRILQLYRPIHLIRYMNNNINRSHLYDAAKYIPLLLLGIDFLSNTGLFTTCSSSIHIDLENPTCIAELWAKVHLNESHASPLIKQHVASVLITTMQLTIVSFYPLKLTSMQELWNSCVMMMTGHIFFVWITARMVSNRFYRKTILTGYQEAMRQLLTFVASRKVDKNIRNEIISYYEFMWKKTKGKNLVQLLSSFSTATKEDILYDIFGKSISTSTIFPPAPKSFFKSLLLESKYEVYVHKGIIYRVNDVHGYIYILLKGTIDVLGADYNKLLILCPGSVFGNLDDCLRSRQTLTMVAKGHVEVLKISTVYFHMVISKYPKILKRFKRLTCFNTDYVENEDTTDLVSARYSTMTLQSKISTATTKTHDLFDTSVEKRFKSVTSLKQDRLESGMYVDKKRRCPLLFKVFNERGKIRIIQLIIITVCCFFGFHLELYQLTNYHRNIPFVCVLYFLDLLYLIKIYLHFRTTYVDENGSNVTNLRLIANYYLRKRYGFYFDLVVMFPCELLSLCFITQSYFWYAWSWLRKNRMLRIMYFFYLLKISQEKLHVNVKVVRIIYMIAWLTVILQAMSAFLLTIHIFSSPTIENKLSLLIKSYEIITYGASSAAALKGTEMSFDMYSVITSIILMLVCKFFITLFIAEMCGLIENAQQNKSQYRVFTLYLKHQIKEEDVSPPLRKRICEYLNLLWTQHRGVQFPSLLREAPYYLKEAILNAMYGFHLRRHTLIRHCHTDLIRQMAACFDVLIFFPGNFVAYVGDIDGCMYFIHKGEVDALAEDSLFSELSVDTLVTGDCFGLDQGLYSNCSHNYSYKVTKKSVILALHKDKWFHLLQFFPASKRVLFELRDMYMDK